MTREQRILERVRYIKKNYVLGAGRTTALAAVKARYFIGEGRLRALCLHQSGCDYWR